MSAKFEGWVALILKRSFLEMHLKFYLNGFQKQVWRTSEKESDPMGM
jgi:hypothetical protein